MTLTPRTPAHKRAAALGAAALAVVGLGTTARGQINGTNWGTVTAPVYGTHEALTAGGLYSSAELLAGPNKAAEMSLAPGLTPSYFDAVLPNGRKVTPAGAVAQIGMHPLGSALTPDGRYIVISCDDERNITGGVSTQPTTTSTGATAHLNGAYTITVLRTADMTVAAQTGINSAVGPLFLGLQVTGTGPYAIYASGGGAHNVKVITFTPPAGGTPGGLALKTSIPIAPISPGGTPTNFTVSNFTQGDYPENSGNSGGGINPNSGPASVNGTGGGNPSPSSGINVGGGVQSGGDRLTFPSGSALSPDGRYLYVACGADDSLAVISTATNTVINQIAVGYQPYGVTVSRDGTKVLVSNWGVQQYRFLAPPASDGHGGVSALASVSPGQNIGGLFFVPVTSAAGPDPQTSSVSVISVPGGNPRNARRLGSVYEGQPGGLDDRSIVGETHPSATAIVRRGSVEVEYVTKSNSDSLGLILVANDHRLPDFDLSPLNLHLGNHVVHGTYPNALAVSPDNTRVYVAEAGLDSVAVLDTADPSAPRLIGRIPTDWYPTALSVSADGKTLYIVNDKGIGEDINPNTNNGVPANRNPAASGVESFSNSNSLFGTLQKVDLTHYTPDMTTALANDYAVNMPADTSVVPLGGAASAKIKHVIFILHENKTFDTILGRQSGRFGAFASTTFNAAGGADMAESEGGAPAGTGYTAVTPNTNALALAFATGVNYYSDADESDGGHQFSASGTESDYTEKTLLVKGGRGLLSNKNMEPEDYPEGGYIFNNAARNGVSFKDYGALIRVTGTDNGYSVPTTTVDPAGSGAGAPVVTTSPPPAGLDYATTHPVTGTGDTTSPLVSLGQSYFLKGPILAILGEANASGEPHLDPNYPGYNFAISDQRRAREFIADFDRMVKAGTLPTFLYVYQPNDHTGTTANSANGTQPTGGQLVADGDTGLGMVVQHIMTSPVYYSDPSRGGDGTGTAIIFTDDDAQSGLDHLDPHRTPMIVISPYAKPAYAAKRHYSTASIVKTEELLMGLPPNNYGDLFATDLRDMFQPTYNGITAADVPFNVNFVYTATAEGRRVWTLAARLDSSGPDQDSYRLSLVTLLSMQADALHREAARKGHLHAAPYLATQARIFRHALRVVNGPRVGGDSDD